MQEQSRSKKVLPRTLPQAQASNSRLGRVISFGFAALALVSASNAAIALEVRFSGQSIFCETKADLLQVAKSLTKPKILEVEMLVADCIYGKDLRKQVGGYRIKTGRPPITFDEGPVGIVMAIPIQKLDGTDGVTGDTGVVYALKQHVTIVGNSK